MTLSEYMTLANLSDARLADALGTDRKAVWRWRNGRGRPSYAMIEKIAAHTKGAVTANDWFPLAREAA